MWTREFRGEAIRWHISQLGNLSIVEVPERLDALHCETVPAAVFASGQWVAVENVEATDPLRGVSS